MFFFVNYEGIRLVQGETKIAQVPGCNLNPCQLCSYHRQPGGRPSDRQHAASLAQRDHGREWSTGSIERRKRERQRKLYPGTLRLQHLEHRFHLCAVHLRQSKLSSNPSAAVVSAVARCLFGRKKITLILSSQLSNGGGFSIRRMVNVARFSFSRPGTNEFTGKTAPGGLAPTARIPSSISRLPRAVRTAS